MGRACHLTSAPGAAAGVAAGAALACSVMDNAMIKNFRHVCIVVRDLDRSIKFYRDILGLEVSKILTVEGKYPESVLNVKGLEFTYVKLRSPGQSKNNSPVFELHYWRKPKILPRPGYNHIAFTVKKIDYEYKRLSRLGVKFISKPMGAPDGRTKICFGRDPDGYLIEFIEDLQNR